MEIVTYLIRLNHVLSGIPELRPLVPKELREIDEDLTLIREILKTLDEVERRHSCDEMCKLTLEADFLLLAVKYADDFNVYKQVEQTIAGLKSSGEQFEQSVRRLYRHLDLLDEKMSAATPNRIEEAIKSMIARFEARVRKAIESVGVEVAKVYEKFKGRRLPGDEALRKIQSSYPVDIVSLDEKQTKHLIEVKATASKDGIIGLTRNEFTLLTSNVGSDIRQWLYVVRIDRESIKSGQYRQAIRLFVIPGRLVPRLFKEDTRSSRYIATLRDIESSSREAAVTEWLCPKCKREIPDGRRVKFCPECGMRLQEVVRSVVPALFDRCERLTKLCKELQTLLSGLDKVKSLKRSLN